MRTYALKRLLLALPLILTVSSLVFLLTHLLPGDPTDFMVSEHAALEDKEAFRRAHHLHLPVLVNLWPFEQPTSVRARLASSSGSDGDAARRAQEDRAEVQAAILYRLGTSDPDPLVRHAALDALGIGLERLARPTPAGDATDPELLEARAIIETHNREVARDNAELAALRTDATLRSTQPLNARWAAVARARGIDRLPSAGEKLRAMVFETQYAWFFRDLLEGRFESLHTHQSVVSTLRQKFPMTLRLGLAALSLALAIALPLGTWAARRQHSLIDNLGMLGSLIGMSMPNFWLGPLLILLFSIELNWFPVSGAEGLRSLALPALTLGLGMAALLTRMTRASVLEVIHEDYVRTARAKGLSERQVVLRHALRNALIPVVTILGLQFGAVLSGSIITEEIFGWPGIGRELVNAIRTRDFPMVQGCVLLISGVYLVANLVTDLAYGWLNPRVRFDRGE